MAELLGSFRFDVGEPYPEQPPLPAIDYDLRALFDRVRQAAFA